jgi:hypothetical protein
VWHCGQQAVAQLWPIELKRTAGEKSQRSARLRRSMRRTHACTWQAASAVRPALINAAGVAAPAASVRDTGAAPSSRAPARCRRPNGRCRGRAPGARQGLSAGTVSLLSCNGNGLLLGTWPTSRSRLSIFAFRSGRFLSRSGWRNPIWAVVPLRLQVRWPRVTPSSRARVNRYHPHVQHRAGHMVRPMQPEAGRSGQA